ncbi:MAG: class I tRNA ligase family protein, partial [Patescibacteria group bacterium]
MKIYNTLTKKLELLPAPDKQKKLKMFVCGPTVYDYIHIGNARTFVFFDIVAKYLKYKGYDVEYIQNITDIDNKIIEQAQKKGVDPMEHAKKYSEIFKEDMLALGITSPKYKNATDHIPEVIKQVQTLLDKGNAYVIENDGIYFDLSTFPDYGKLSGRTASMADDAVSRIDDSDKKRNRGDFAVWKFS